MDFVKYWLHRRPAISRSHLLLLTGFWAFGPVFAQSDASGSATDSSVASAEAVLERFVAEVATLTADFTQSEFDADGELLNEIATGRFSLLRPNRFRLQQDLPFERILDADGVNLWDYDVDLEQVTRAPLSELAANPAMLLSGEGSIGDGYELTSLPATDGLSWIELTPIDVAGSDFLSAKIAFDGSVPVVLELINGLRNLTRVEFFDVEVNPGLDPALFDFEPPGGVRVVGSD
jgi:outer membrane lipoprotein carrier protein